MKKQTFADRAKQIMSKYKTRLGENFDKGDALALEAMNQELSLLRDEQETERAKLEFSMTPDESLPMYITGGQTEIPYRSASEYPENQLTNVMAPWSLDTYYPKPEASLHNNIPAGSNVSIVTDSSGKIKINTGATSLPRLNLSPVPKYSGGSSRKSSMPVDGGELDRLKTLNAWGFQNHGYLNEGVSKLQTPSLSNYKAPGLQKTNNILATDPAAGNTPFKSRVPWMGAVSGIVGNLLMNKQLDLPEYNPETYTPTRVSPHLVNYSRSREQVLGERDLADNMILNSAKGTGSQNQLMESLLAGKTATQRTAGQQFNASLENESNTNAQIRNQADQMSAQLSADAARMNMQNQLYSNQVKRENMLMNAERKNAKIQGITDSATGYFKDRIAADRYDNMLQMMAPDNYSVVAGQDSKLRKFFDVSPTIKMILSGTDSMKKENGGYIGDIQLFGDEKYEKLMMRLNKDKKK